ncbi:unnamed protein product [Heligmosomoides polygyrus]|uniref:N1221 domain-containing protein n=1 Tax=Heligmosomoides polygyrus TaxID=6339 RepID=A0A3P8ANJ0_HELPZ|nr:unnamed protein product [Heligmosomoides polygyrus]
MQDNASEHASRSTIPWLNSKNIQVLGRPACSPHLNPIENISKIIVRQTFADGKQFNNVKERRRAIEAAWNHLDSDNLKNLAEMYGDKKGTQTEEVEYSESSLAQRRSALLVKLKQLKDSHGTTTTTDAMGNRTESVDMASFDHRNYANESDIEFEYNDCDTLLSELAELYTYSELDDFASNIQCWKIQEPFHFSSLPESKKLFIMQDLCARMESAESDVRLASARIVLYILQGAYLDFGEEEEVEAGLLLSATNLDKGTGGHEKDCLCSAFLNAHIAYKAGTYQALCTLLMAEICEPFDTGVGMTTDGGRESKASSRGSRCPSSADLAEGGSFYGISLNRRSRRAATMADNEAMRVVLSALYHMVELIRNEELTESMSVDDPSLSSRRSSFLEELGEPLDHVGQPLLLVLFEMLPPFYTGSSPHYPIKKILLLIWKILLATLGGWKHLDALKASKRAALGLPVMENTIAVASALPATIINDNEAGARMAARRIVPIGRVMARQLAYAGSEEAKDEDFDIGAITGDDYAMPDPDGPVKRGPELRQVNSGDRTPRPGSPMPREPPKRCLPWRSKVSKQEIEAFIQQERQKFFQYQLPGDLKTMFALPPPIHRSVETLWKHQYTSIGELQAKNDALNILVDVLTPETDGCDILSNSISLDHSTSSPLEESVRLAIDINRHKEIMVKATSSILLLLMKHFRLNHIYQFEYLCQHIVYGNGIPLLLKFLDQNMTRYVQSRYEIHPYNYPQAPLHYVRNRDEWPVLNSENVEGGEIERRGMYYMWRNMFSSINLIRVLNKLVKGKQSRVMMLMVFKSAPILKRSLKIRLGLFQFFILKALKMQSRYLGRQWRKSNMDIMSAIYNKVRHRMTDDWAFANEMRKSYDYHSEESELKAAVERFHSRRYARLHPQLAIEVNDAPMPGDDYLNRVNLQEYEPVDNCLHSVLGKQPELGKRRYGYTHWLCYAFSDVVVHCSKTSFVGGTAQVRYGVRKTQPIEIMLNDYSKYYWDDSVTEDDPLVKRLREQILAGSRAALASAITLVESKHPKKRSQGNVLLQKGKESMIFRIGISGSPGVGKSSFIEAMGKELIEGRGKKIAVLTIDPTSAVTGGSLLGDLTRMQDLSRNPKAYIRQSPTSGSLGGVTRGIHEAVILCEGAGYDIVIIETVGVGQSEVAVADMCDLFCLLLSPAHGDELQVLRSSIMDPKSITAVADVMFEYWNTIMASGDLERRRQVQMTQWMWSHVQDELLKVFKSHPKIEPLAPVLEEEVRKGKTTPGLASEKLIRTFLNL